MIIVKKPKIRFKGFTETWEQRKLGEYVSITSGEAPSKFDKGTELYVKVDDLNYNDKYVVDTQNKVAEHSTVKRVTKGSVVFPKRGAAIMTNKVRIMGIDSYMDTNMMALTSEKLDSEFLYNIISKEGLYKIADTSTIPQINNKHVEPYEVTIPSLAEQRRIGAYFKQLDHFITLHQRKCENLKKLKKFMLQKLFPQNGENVPKVRFLNFTDTWEQRKLGNIMEVASVKRIHRKDWTDSGVRFLRARDIVSHFKNEKQNDCLYISKEKYDECSALSGKVSVGDLLVTGVGTIGIPYLVNDLNPIYFKDGNIIWFKNGSKINGFFLYYSFIGNEIQNFINVLSGTGTVGTYTIESGKKTSISLPDKLEQQKIGNFLKHLDHLITLHQSKCDKLKEVKKYMLQNMFI